MAQKPAEVLERETAFDVEPELQEQQSMAVQPARPEPVMRGAAGTIERVIVRQTAMVDQLFQALAEAEGEEGYGDIEKTKKARVESRRTGTTYEYTYETLSDVITATRPHLAKHGLTVMQFPFIGRDSVTIRTRLSHSTGQWIENDLAAMITMPDPQAVGSGIAYMRRYAQKSLLNVAATDEDDDGAAASRKPQAPQPAQRRSGVSGKRQESVRAEAAEPAHSGSVDLRPADLNIGTIGKLGQKGEGWMVELETGYRAGTRSSELAEALVRHKADGRRVELVCRPPSDPKYAPTLLEIRPADVKE